MLKNMTQDQFFAEVDGYLNTKTYLSEDCNPAKCYFSVVRLRDRLINGDISDAEIFRELLNASLVIMDGTFQNVQYRNRVKGVAFNGSDLHTPICNNWKSTNSRELLTCFLDKGLHAWASTFTPNVGVTFFGSETLYAVALCYILSVKDDVEEFGENRDDGDVEIEIANITDNLKKKRKSST